jgi:hypothetical protein
VRAAVDNPLRWINPKSMSGAAISQNGSQPSNASCVRSAGKIRHARMPAASHIQRTASPNAPARPAGFDNVDMAHPVFICDGRILPRRGLTH